jgi:Raf kinase inhibitor-like YbhB/YbcL family protein
VLRTAFFAAAAVLATALPSAAESTMTLASATFAPGATIPLSAVYDRSGCTGQNISPELHWSGAPAGTKSFALAVFDPKAQQGVGWYHWLAFDIPAGVHGLRAGAGNGSSTAPRGIIFGRNDFGEVGYGGPCPPVGETHPYQFTLYALNVAHLPVSHATTGMQLGDILRGHILAHATYDGRFGR